MCTPTIEKPNQRFQSLFNASLKVDFTVSRTSEAGVLWCGFEIKKVILFNSYALVSLCILDFCYCFRAVPSLAISLLH